MAGKIKKMLDTIIASKSGGNPTLAAATTTKLILKGLNPNKFTGQSDDDPAVVDKVRNIAAEMGIKL